jgi:hypothetical protein
VLTESAKKLRDPLALGLLGATALYLIAVLSVLFNGDLAGKFANRAAMVQGDFVNPVFVIITVAAVLLVAAVGEPSPMARTVVPAALGVQAFMLLFGVITWFAGYGVDLPDNANAVLDLGGFAGITGAGKIVGTFAMLSYLGILGIGAFLTFTIFQGLPAPVRPQQQQQQWGQPQQQQQWGGQQQWGAAAGGATAGASGAAASDQGWGQPTSGESSSGYAAGGEAGQPPSSGESSSGYAAGGDAGQPAPQPQQWGQPAADPTQQWGQPQPETPQQGEPQEGEDDRPGWWSPSS